MDWRTVGGKNPGRCREVAVSGGSNILAYSNPSSIMCGKIHSSFSTTTNLEQNQLTVVERWPL